MKTQDRVLAQSSARLSRLQGPLVIGLVALLSASCEPSAAPVPVLELGAIELALPPGTQSPNLAVGADGRALLTWLEAGEGDHTSVRFAVREAAGWSEPRTIRSSDHLFANWADFPSSVEMSDGTVAAHWLEKTADATYAYHVMVSLSSDDGATWTEPARVHDDESPTEHGFVSMVPWGDGAAIAWLDGQAMQVPETYGGEGSGHDEGGIRGAMSARFRTLAPDGTLGPEVLLDDRTCECCQTSLAQVSDGLVAAYRDRSEDEIRDIAVVRGAGEAWSEPTHVSQDEWEIPGCPVNGPQLSADGQALAAAWYTGAGGQPQAYVAFSQDGGATFADRIRIDEGVPLGRLDIELLDDGSAIVVWLEASDEAGRVLARRVTATGEMGTPIVVSNTSGERASGFPRLVRVADELVLAWTLPGETGGVRTRSIAISD